MGTIYNTTTLAIEIIGEDAVEANKKAATRTLRKFLRDDMGEGKAVVGKGSRYSLDMTKTQVKAMLKRFKAWEIAQEEAKEARRIALEAIRAPKAEEAIILPTDEGGNEDIDDEGALGIDGIDDPSDADFNAMLEDAVNGNDED